MGTRKYVSISTFLENLTKKVYAKGMSDSASLLELPIRDHPRPLLPPFPAMPAKNSVAVNQRPSIQSQDLLPLPSRETLIAETLNEKHISLPKMLSVLEFFVNKHPPFNFQPASERYSRISIPSNDLRLIVEKIKFIMSDVRSPLIQSILAEIPSDFLRMKTAGAVWEALEWRRGIMKEASNAQGYDSMITTLAQLHNEKLIWHTDDGIERQIPIRAFFRELALFQEQLAKQLHEESAINPNNFFGGMDSGPFGIYQKLRSEVTFLKEKFHSIQEATQNASLKDVNGAMTFVTTIREILSTLHEHQFTFIEYIPNLDYAKICNLTQLLEDIRQLENMLSREEQDPWESSTIGLFQQIQTNTPTFLDLQENLSDAFNIIHRERKSKWISNI